MMKPTEAQIKEFWERCGLTKDGAWWHSPTGKMMDVNSPRIDLNNLFKYAVPKVSEYRLYLSCRRGGDWLVEIYGKGGTDIGVNDKDLALALFWALREVLDNEKIK